MDKQDSQIDDSHELVDAYPVIVNSLTITATIAYLVVIEVERVTEENSHHLEIKIIAINLEDCTRSD